MKKISLAEITEKYKLSEYNVLYQKILTQIENGELKPIKNSGLNGKKPALYNAYWIIDKKESEAPYLEELSFIFVPTISTDYYLSHITQYIEDRKWLLWLNDYLKNHSDRLLIPMSLNERSFDIWHREKFLKKEHGNKILKRCNIELDFLNIYETAEPLAYYAHTKSTPQNILIIENKDTFYSIRKLLMSENTVLLGKTFSTIIYGAGKGIIKSFRDFELCCEPYMRETSNQIYYFGDLDYEGILIYENLANVYKDKCEIKPFCEAYLKMMDQSDIIGENNLPITKEGQNSNIGVLFTSYFTEADKKKILSLLENRYYIPQEILNISSY
jgi:hypothetical protein